MLSLSCFFALIKRLSFDRVVGRVHLSVGIMCVKFLHVSNKLVWLKSLFVSLKTDRSESVLPFLLVQ